MSARHTTAAAAGQPLTRREWQVLSGVFHGRTYPQIGAYLGLSHHTVRSHMATAKIKLAAPNRAQAVARAFAPALAGGRP